MKTWPGINIQFPISRLILDGKKTIETRTYPLPQKYLNVPIALIETPGKSGDFKSRAVAIIKFSECKKYKNKTEFYNDIKRHHVSSDSPWAWNHSHKWGWRLEILRKFKAPIELKQRIGIVYTKEIRLGT